MRETLGCVNQSGRFFKFFIGVMTGEINKRGEKGL